MPIFLTSCSIFYGPEGTSLRLRDTAEAQLVDESSPFVYRLPGDPSSAPYVTAVQDCSPGSKQKITALSRQLFVGLEGVEVHNLKELSVQGKPFDEAEVSAHVGKDRFSFVAYTGKGDSGCVVDLLFWREHLQNSGDSAPLKLLASDVRSKAERILPSLLQ